jgi:hypothetical protein
MAAVAADAAPAGGSCGEDKPIIRDFDGSDADFEKVHARAGHRPPALSRSPEIESIGGAVCAAFHP